MMNDLPARRSGGAEGGHESACPFGGHSHSISQADFETWLGTELRCSAGKREFQLGRYSVARVRNGYQFAQAFADFEVDVQERRKTGFLAIVETQECFDDAEAELRFISQLVVDAGFAESAGALVRGETIAVPIEVECPVTGRSTSYDFFPVAFCRHAAAVLDPLYDPSLSAPFLAVNTTSDAYAFGMMVRDLSLRHFHCEPHEIPRRVDLERLLHKCAMAWQNMSANTISSYNRVSAVPQRAVALSDDHRRWTAPHNDPVFAELEKQTHSHEMPVIYAERLCRKWIAALYEDAELTPGRDGQSGGTHLALEDIAATFRP